MKRSNELIKTALQGLRYLQTYAWLSLRTLVTAGYLGWIVFAFTTAVDVYALNGKIDVQRRTRTHYNFYLDPGRALQSAHFLGITDQILRIRLLSSLVLGRGFCAVEGAGRAQEKTVFAVFESDTVNFSLNITAYLALLEVMKSFACSCTHFAAQRGGRAGQVSHVIWT
ncbi:hypothetical protein BDV40DRAFT_304496 [Aspergillus tamarii]|uniref:GPI ethanolamine phosphate transferase 1 n=1 Tax=Aspergillus tamarii TaxID=41984 RepID=A0A5N6UHZ2_ASPTM|nr:hypothetical protein BDV40DRAFT_304496 [Aspergillus tamarii]